MLANQTRGFTLVELVIGIVVFSVALVFFVSVVVPQSVRSVDPIFQVRAAELAQSLMDEITGKSFDDASDRVGGTTLCDSSCTSASNLGAESGESRASYNDVDDYNGLDKSDSEIENALGVEHGLYSGFNITVSVMYDANMDGVDDNAVGNLKLITVTVTTPNNEQIAFSTYKGNF